MLTLKVAIYFYLLKIVYELVAFRTLTGPWVYVKFTCRENVHQMYLPFVI